MKKSLLALAVLGSFAAAAQAQTSVTIYGVVDMGVFYQNKAGGNNNSLFAVQSGEMSGSRLGFKGSEDLGGGLKANFVLEMGFTANTGAVAAGTQENGSTGTLFGRTSTVGLSGNFGSVNLGKQTDFAYSGTDGGMNTFSSAGYVTNFSQVDGNRQARLQGDRTDNSIRYDMPVMNGLNGGVMYGLGQQAGGGSAGSVWAAGLKYDNGPLAFGGDYYQSKVGATPADRNLISTQSAINGTGGATGAVATAVTANMGSTATKTFTLGASYDFGFGKLYGNWSRVTMLPLTPSGTLSNSQIFNTGSYGSQSANNKLDMFEIGYNHNLTASLKLLTGLAHTNVSFDNGQPQGRLNQAFIGTDYFMSKRTDLYAVATYVRTSDVANPLAVSGTAATGNPNNLNAGSAYGMGVGIRHTF